MENTELARLLQDSNAIIQRQAEMLAVLEEEAEFARAVKQSSDTVDMSEVAKVLNMGMGRNKLFELLREKGVLRYNNEPYQDYVDRGYFRIVEQRYVDSYGHTKVGTKTVVYQKGVDFIRKILKEVTA